MKLKKGCLLFSGSKNIIARFLVIIMLFMNGLGLLEWNFSRSANAYNLSAAYTEVSGDIGEDTVWEKSKSPYLVVNDITVKSGITLQIEPGVVIKFSDKTWAQGGFKITVEGTMQVSGTNAEPVYFTAVNDELNTGAAEGAVGTATSPASGWWEGIYVKNNGTAILAHTHLKYSGAYWQEDGIYRQGAALFKSGAGGLEVRESSISYGKLGIVLENNSGPVSITNTSFENNISSVIVEDNSGPVSIEESLMSGNEESGLYYISGTGNFNINNVRFTDNEYGIRISPNNSLNEGSLFVNNPQPETFIANNYDVFIDEGDITEDITWTFDNNYPVYLNNINIREDASLNIGQGVFLCNDIEIATGAILNIAPRSILKFGTSKAVNVYGEINAEGSFAAPVYLTARHDSFSGGDTEDIGGNPSEPQGTWEHWYGIHIHPSGKAIINNSIIKHAMMGIIVDGTADLFLEDSTISESSVTGLSISSFMESGELLIRNNSFKNNRNGATVYSAETVEFINCHFIDNEEFGITGNNVDAVNCWWGDPSGPHHYGENPDGLGDAVSDGVSFIPWLEHITDSKILSPKQSGTIIAGDSLYLSGSIASDPTMVYNWDFGDGRTSSQRMPGLVTFRDSGDYQVRYETLPSGTALTNPDTRDIKVVPRGEHPDLKVTEIKLAQELNIGAFTGMTYTAQNIGNTNAENVNGWTDALYLSSDPYLDAEDIFLGSHSVDTAVTPGSSYGGNISFTIPTVEPGAYYLILSIDDDWQIIDKTRLNNESARIIEINIPNLNAGVELYSEYKAGQVEHYYKLEAKDAETLLLNIESAPGLEVYMRYGILPTRRDYDYRTSDGNIVIPTATGGEWFVMVYGTMASGDKYSIIFEQASIALTSVSPNLYSIQAPLQLNIKGAGFMEPLQVDLIGSDMTEHRAQHVTVNSFTGLTATFAADVLTADIYSVMVTSAQRGSVQLDSVLEMVENGEAALEVDLILPERMGYHLLSTIYVEYSNTGSVSMPAPLLEVKAEQNGRQAAIITLDDNRLTEGFWTRGMPEGFSNSVKFLARGETPGLLQPGETMRLPVYYAGWLLPWDMSWPPIDWDISVLYATDETPIDWNELKDQLRPSFTVDDAWDAVWNNYLLEAGSTWGDYVSMLNSNAAYLYRQDLKVDDIEKLWAFSMRKADNLNPLSVLAAETDNIVENVPGIALEFERVYMQPISRRFENGDFGKGWTHNWQISLEEKSEGIVAITGINSTSRFFGEDQRYSRRYIAQQPGDGGRLTRLTEGGYLLEEASGMIYAFLENGSLHYVKDTNDNRIDCTYKGGSLTRLTHSSGPRLDITYNDSGHITAIKDAHGRETNYSYESDYLISARYNDGSEIIYDYNRESGNASHALNLISFPGDGERTFSYDESGRLVSLHREGDGAPYTFSYLQGQVSVTDPLGNRESYYFDYAGRIVKTKDALESITLYTFDKNGNLTKITDHAGYSISYDYDRTGNLTAITDPRYQTVTFTYSQNYSGLSSFTDANGNRTLYTTDNKGNLSSVTYPDGTRESWSYDEKGNPVTMTNRRGETISYQYDENSRFTGTLFPDGSEKLFSYDSRGNLIEAENEFGPISFTYNDYDYPVRMDYPDGYYLEFTYDTQGRRSSRTDQNGRKLNYRYNNHGDRLGSITDQNDEELISFEYDDAGRLARRTTGNGIISDYEYDAIGRLQTLVNNNTSGDELSTYTYSYNIRGLLSTAVTSYGCWQYRYDESGRLTSSVLESTDDTIPDQELLYEYDSAGNRVLAVINGEREDYTINELNQYTESAERSFTYDSDGNLTREESPAGMAEYIYDAENILLSVSRADIIKDYTYDAMGNRALIKENNTESRLIYDPFSENRLIGEYDKDGTTSNTYIYSPDGLEGFIDSSGETYFYTFDPLGNTSELTGSGGNPLNRYTYNPFGELISATEAIANPFEYSGRYGLFAEQSDYSLPSGGQSLTALQSIRLKPFREHSNNRGGRIDTGMRRDLTNIPKPPRELMPFEPPRSISLCASMGGALGIHGGFGMIKLGGKIAAMGAGNPLVMAAGAAVAVYGVYEAVRGGSDVRGGVRAETRTTMDQQVGEFSGPGIPLKTVNERWNPGQNRLKTPGRFARGLAGDAAGRLAVGSFCEWENSRAPAVPASTLARASGDTVGAFDPNQKLGVSGFGQKNYVSPKRPLTYRIDFENLEEATAPAQIATVRDPLSGDLDWSTFEITELGFNNRIVAVSPGNREYSAVIDYRYQDEEYELDMEVHIEAWLDNGTVYANFFSIDPATGLPPSDPENGFLPPEDGTGRGQGHISYMIKPRTGLASGTVIRNVATIQFDYGLEIDTNQIDPLDKQKGIDPELEAAVTIDNAPPVSSIESLPAITSTETFNVSWSGDDDEFGSGIASYDIYVSENQGPWQLWLKETTNSVELFTGIDGSEYTFYSIARDNVGHIEEKLPVSESGTVINAEEATIYGDINNDGTVNVQDAILVLRHIVGLINISDEYGPSAIARAHVRGESDIAVGDAILILRFVVGLLENFPAEDIL